MPSDHKNVVVHLRNTARDRNLLRWHYMMQDKGESPRDIIRKILSHAVHGYNLNVSYKIPADYMNKPAEEFESQKIVLKVKPAEHQLIMSIAGKLSSATGSFVAAGELAKILLRDTIIVEGENENSDDIRNMLSRTEAFISIVPSYNNKKAPSLLKEESVANISFNSDSYAKEALRQDVEQSKQAPPFNSEEKNDATTAKQEKEVKRTQNHTANSSMKHSYINPAAITRGMNRNR